MIMDRMLCTVRKHLGYISFLFLFMLSGGSSAQVRNLEFKIVHHGDLSGTVRLSEFWEGNVRRIKVESLVQTRFLFKITVRTVEEAVYREGLLIFSRFYQKTNDQEASDRSMIWKDGTYKFLDGQKKGFLPNAPVELTVLSLYCNEPVNVREVFSDNFQQFLPVKKTGPGQYRINLPDGNSNYYTYQQGKLVCVEAEQPFHDLKFIITP